jgi:hypothetical protein
LRTRRSFGVGLLARSVPPCWRSVPGADVLRREPTLQSDVLLVLRFERWRSFAVSASRTLSRL